jgi:hypothetical protein
MRTFLRRTAAAAVLVLAALGLNEVAQVAVPTRGHVAPPWVKTLDLRGLLRAEPVRLVGILTARHLDAHGLRDLRQQRQLIVNAGENFLVDAWQNSVELETMKFHGIGTGTVAAAEADTALGTELTTQYNPDNTRATGSLTEGAGTNVFRTVGTNTVDAAVAITEWGLFTQAATGGGTIWSRTVFSAINLSSGDSLQTTYDLTVE